jgi:hypothetical protein
MIYPGFIKGKIYEIMEKQALKRIFDFLEEKEKHRETIYLEVEK